MRVLFVLSGAAAGAVIAFILNKFLTGKIENKSQRIGLQISAYVVFMLLGFIFSSIFSLRYFLDRFIDNRINAIEVALSRRFPNTNIMEISFNTSELKSLNDELQQSIRSIDTSDDSLFEKMFFDAFISEITKYTNAVNSGVNILTAISNDDGTVTIKAVFYGIKDLALDTVSPYFFVLQIAILIVLIICIGIYCGIAIYLKKGGGIYNKSIVYGDNQ
jgi:hypothetical protein